MLACTRTNRTMFSTFDTIVTYFTGDSSSLRSVIVDDFNNDNHLDIAFADYGTDSIGIFPGNGNRTFGKLMTYSTGESTRPYSIATGDFNNDSRLGFAVTNYGSNTIGIFLGSENYTYTLFTTCSTGDGSLPWMLTIADLNQDNHLDIIVVNPGSNNLGVFFGFDNGSFDAQQSYSTGSSSSPYWVSVADFNNDESLDLAVANSNTQNVGILLGNRYGYFGNQTTYPTGSDSTPFSIAVSDFNKDNRLDIAVVAYGTNNIDILLGHPTNDVPILLGDYYEDFLYQITYLRGSSSLPYSVAVGDLNGDGLMDIVVANSGHENLGILLGYGNGTFTDETTYSIGVGSSPRHVLISDFNKENQSDVTLTNTLNDNITVLLGNGNGTFATEMIYSTGSESNPTTLAISNLNNDEYIDLVVANEGINTIGIFFGFDYIVFAKQKSNKGGDGSDPTSVAIGDFNKDGHLDIVCTLYGNDNVGVFLGYGNGSFTPITTYSNVPSSRPWGVAVGDFDNDKQLDITVANWGTDNIGVLLGYGNGTFVEPILYSTSSGSRPAAINVGDFNNDHCLDIVAANYGGNSIAVFLGYGNGTFQDVLLLSAGQGSRPASVTVFDINNDTQFDIIVANEGLTMWAYILDMVMGVLQNK
jgi:hypothetical protein